VWDARTGKVRATVPVRLGTGEGAVLWSPDGARLAVGGQQEVRVWDVEAGREVATLRDVGGPASAALARWLTWAPKGDRLASAATSGTVRLWQATTGALGGELGVPLPPQRGALASAAWGPEGRLLASATPAGLVQVWSGVDGRLRHTLEEPPSFVAAVACSPDGRLLAAGHGDGEVTVWDAREGRKLHAWRRHSGPVTGLAFSPDGQRLASTAGAPSGGVGKGGVTVWGLADGKELFTRVAASSPYGGLTWGPDGRLLAAASGGLGKSLPPEVKVWDGRTGQEKLARPVGGHAWVTLAWGRGGHLLAAGSGGTVRAWDVGTGKDVAPSGLALPEGVAVRAVAWAPAGDRLALVVLPRAAPKKVAAPILLVWDVAKGKEVLRRALVPHTSLACAWGPDGRLLAVTGDAVRKSPKGPAGKEAPAKTVTDGYLVIVDVGTGTVKQALRGPALWQARLSWSADGRRIAASTFGGVRVWETGVGKEPRELAKGAAPVLPAWGPAGAELVTAGADWTLQVWDAATGKQRLALGRSRGPAPAFPGGRSIPVALAWGPDGRLATSASLERTIRLWDGASGKATGSLPAQGEVVQTLAWAPDGKHLASAGRDGKVKVWDLAAGKATRSFDLVVRRSGPATGAQGDGLPLAWSPAGDRLAAGDDAGNVRVWDAGTGAEVVRPAGHKAKVSAVAWSPDGRRLASAGSGASRTGGQIKVWDTRTGEELLTLNGGDGSLSWSADGWRLASGDVLWDVSPPPVPRRDRGEER
jgi:WD40 repeat protein